MLPFLWRLLLTFLQPAVFICSITVWEIIISVRGQGRGGWPPSLYLELPQVYCSVSGNIELGKNISDVLLVHLVVADGIQVFDHLLDVNKATVVAVNGIEEFLIINKQG